MLIVKVEALIKGLIVKGEALIKGLIVNQFLPQECGVCFEDFSCVKKKEIKETERVNSKGGRVNIRVNS